MAALQQLVLAETARPRLLEALKSQATDIPSAWAREFAADALAELSLVDEESAPLVLKEALARDFPHQRDHLFAALRQLGFLESGPDRDSREAMLARAKSSTGSVLASRWGKSPREHKEEAVQLLREGKMSNRLIEYFLAVGGYGYLDEIAQITGAVFTPSSVLVARLKHPDWASGHDTGQDGRSVEAWDDLAHARFFRA